MNALGQPQPVEREEDLADRLLGEEEAQRIRSQGRRRRGVRRRLLRAHLASRPSSTTESPAPQQEVPGWLTRTWMSTRFSMP